jgi:hypothetical protein
LRKRVTVSLMEAAYRKQELISQIVEHHLADHGRGGV